jgi:hypothetical protein
MDLRIISTVYARDQGEEYLKIPDLVSLLDLRPTQERHLRSRLSKLEYHHILRRYGTYQRSYGPNEKMRKKIEDTLNHFGRRY